VSERSDAPPALEPAVQPRELRGELDVRTIVCGVLVAAIMGASYPYMVLKLGFGPNVSVVAAFFGFLFLRITDLGTGHYNRWQNNLAEAAGTSAAQTAFMCVLLGAFDILRHDRPDIFDMTLTPMMSFLWLSAACSLGVLMAVPLRRHFVVDEKLPYADGLATAETIAVMDPPRTASAEVKRNALAAFRAVMLGVVLSGLLMVFRSDTRLVPLTVTWNLSSTSILDWLHSVAAVPWIPDGWAPPWTFGASSNLSSTSILDWLHSVAAAPLGLALASMGVGVSYSLLSIGSGMIVGLRINLSMIAGSVLAWVVAPYFLVRYGVSLHHVERAGASVMEFTATPRRNEVLFWVMWPATGMLVVGGLTALALRWRLLIDTFKSLRTAKIGSAELPLSVVIGGSAVCAIALCTVQAVLLDMPVWMTLAAIVLSVPLMLVGLRVLGETNWGPISALSNMMQGVFAALAPGNIAANMVASGTTGTIATSSEAIMQDYKCGEIIGTRPRNLTIMQLIAVPVGAAAVSWIYPALVGRYGIVGDHAQLTSPISNKWSGFAQILKDGAQALPASALYALAIFSLLGIVLTVLEANPRVRRFVPSPTGLGIGILVPFNVVFTMFLGGVVGYVWERADKKSADIYMIPLASGLIAGEAIVAVVGAVYFAASGS
jgi:uncharacterized oligopeptide transporter (OPT) family protein